MLYHDKRPGIDTGRYHEGRQHSMRTARQIITFLTLVTLTVGSAHYYIYSRFVGFLSLGDLGRHLTFAILAALFVAQIALLMTMRGLPRKYASPLAWLVYSWMGMSLFAFVVFLGADILFLGTGVAQMFGIQYIEDLNHSIGLTAIALAVFLSVKSLLNAGSRVAVKPVSISIKKLPKSLDGLTITQLTDLHIGPTLNGKWLQRVVDQANALESDIIAITGDLVDGSVEELGVHVAPLKNLKAKYGVYFITGNHEYYSGVDAWIAYLRQMGIRVLRNETVTIPPDATGDAIDLIGIDDYASGGFPGHGPNLPKAMRDHTLGRATVLLAHQPAAVIEASTFGIDLQLSGHTHGGQIWPFNYTVKLQQPYVSGLHKHAETDTQVYISRGTGYWGPPMRLGAPAEITKITLKASN